MILEPGLVRFSKKRELHGHKKVENIWTSSYCTFLQIKDTDIIVGFGLNNCFQLGVQDMENRYQPEVLQAISIIPSKIKKIAGGMHHTLFLDTDGHVYSMGSHRYGSLGLGTVDADVHIPTLIPNLDDVVDIAANTNVSYAVKKSGKVYSWGTNYSKQLCQDTEDDYLEPTLVKSKNFDVRNVYMVDIGGQHSLFVASDEKDEDDDEDDDDVKMS
jgi:regulator of chromosome condensation